MSDEKRQLLIEALQGVNDSLELRYAPPRVRAEMLADRVIAEGWQWHPPKEASFREIWRTIPGHPYYEMTRDGDIRSKTTRYEPERVETINSFLYILRCDGHEHGRTVEQLLQETFPTEEL